MSRAAVLGLEAYKICGTLFLKKEYKIKYESEYVFKVRKKITTMSQALSRQDGWVRCSKT